MPYFHVKMAPKLPHGVWIGYERLPRVKGTLMFHIYQVGGHWTFRTYLFQPLYILAPCNHVNFGSLTFLFLLPNRPFPEHQIEMRI